jgi:hypothetical protein
MHAMDQYFIHTIHPRRTHGTPAQQAAAAFAMDQVEAALSMHHHHHHHGPWLRLCLLSSL